MIRADAMASVPRDSEASGLRALLPRDREWIVVGVAFLLSIAAKGLAVFDLGYAVDDYGRVEGGVNYKSLSGLVISQGRILQAVTAEMLHQLGVEAPTVNVFYAMLLLAALVWIALLISRWWNLGQDAALSTIVVLLIALHPYHAENFTFRIAGIYYVFALVLSFVGFSLSEWRIRSLIVGASLIVLSLHIYQIVLNYLLLSTVATFAIALVRDPGGFARSTWGSAWRASKSGPRVAMLCLTVVLYVLSSKATQALTKIEANPRGHILSSEEIPERAAQVTRFYHDFLFEAEPVVPVLVKLLMLVVFIFATARVAMRLRHAPSLGLAAGGLITLTALLLLAFACVAGTNLPLKSWWPVPRVVAHAGILWAACATIAVADAGPLVRRTLLVLTGVIVFAFVGINNHVFTDQVRINGRDRLKASRIVARFEALPEFGKLRALAIVGAQPRYALRFDTVIGDMNVSGFATPWSKLSVLREISGYDFARPTPADTQLAEARCEKAGKWPHPESVAIEGDLGILCF